MLFYKIICIFLFAFLSNPDFAWLLVAVLILGSTWNYIKCKAERPYYNETIALLWNITNAIYLWVNIVLLLCMTLRYTLFSGGIQLIGLGIPLIFIMEYYSAHPSKKLLAIPIDAITDHYECEHYLRYLSYTCYFREQRENSIFFNS